MPITSIVAQPGLGLLMAAYRPIVYIVDAATTNPVVYCDIYFDGVFYKTLSKTQPIHGTTNYFFDISDAAQEVLDKYMALNGGSVIVLTDDIIIPSFCRFRGSTIDVNGFTIADPIVPVQGTGLNPPVAGDGVESLAIDVVNSTLQHEDIQFLGAHLATFKQGIWGRLVYPLTHRTDNYRVCPNGSDYFPIISNVVPDCIRVHFKLKNVIPGPAIPASTVVIRFEGNTAAREFAFTLSGVPQTGTIVVVDFTVDTPSTTGSTVATNFVGNLSATNWAFTLKGTPKTGTIVKVDVDANVTGTPASSVITVLDGNASSSVYQVTFDGIVQVGTSIAIGVDFDVPPRPASTLNANTDGNISSKIYEFSVSGTPQAGAQVILNLHMDIDGTTGIDDYVFAQTAGNGWTLDNIVQAIYFAMLDLVPTPTVSLVIVGGFPGIRVTAFSTISGFVTIMNSPTYDTAIHHYSFFGITTAGMALTDLIALLRDKIKYVTPNVGVMISGGYPGLQISGVTSIAATTTITNTPSVPGPVNHYSVTSTVGSTVSLSWIITDLINKLAAAGLHPTPYSAGGFNGLQDTGFTTITGTVTITNTPTIPGATVPHTVTSTSQVGWGMPALLTDLYNKIKALNANTISYTAGGFFGVKTFGYSAASGDVTVTNTVGSGGTGYTVLDNCSTVCVGVGFSGSPVLPDGIAGTLYHYEITLTGTAPFVLTVVTKPAWMTITLVGNKVTLNGIPPTSGPFDVEFNVSNCAGANTVNLAQSGDINPVCVPPSNSLSLTLPDAEIDEPYLFDIPLAGTPPFTITIVSKPAWMTIKLTGGPPEDTLHFTGIPVAADENDSVPIAVNVTNACGTYAFSDNIAVRFLFGCNDQWGIENENNTSYIDWGYWYLDNPTGILSMHINWFSNNDRPNKFTVVDESGTDVFTTNWVGVAAYPGPWGMSLSTPTSGMLSYTPIAGHTYKVRVESGNGAMADSWDVSISCIPSDPPNPDVGTGFVFLTYEPQVAGKSDRWTAFADACTALTNGIASGGLVIISPIIYILPSSLDVTGAITGGDVELWEDSSCTIPYIDPVLGFSYRIMENLTNNIIKQVVGYETVSSVTTTDVTPHAC